jgi:hypothetical protein
MRWTIGIMILFLTVLAFPLPVYAAILDGEVTLLGATSTGDYGTDIDSDAHWLMVRYVTGNTFQFSVNLSMLQVDTIASGMTYTSLGPTSLGQGGWQGQHEASGSGQGEGLVPSLPVDSSAAGLGDVRLAVSRKMIGGGVKLFRLDASVEVKVPTADDTDNLGTGEWDYRLGVAGEYRFWAATMFGGLGWNTLGDPNWVEFNAVLDVYFGVDSDPLAGERLVVTGWVEGWQETLETVGSRAVLGIGLRTTGSVRWKLQARTGLTDAAEDLSVSVGVAFGISPVGPGSRGYQR